AALAKDVQRYLADEPVSAFQEPWTFKLRRWVARHRTLTTASAAALLGATASLAVTTVFLEQAKAREPRDRAREASARTQAEDNLQLARGAVHRYFTTVSNNPRLKAYGLEKLRQELLKNAREFFDAFARQTGGDPQAEAERGRNSLQLARI